MYDLFWLFKYNFLTSTINILRKCSEEDNRHPITEEGGNFIYISMGGKTFRAK